MAEETTRAVQTLISRHACPEKILSDKGTSFTSNQFGKVCKQYSIQHIQSTAFHHQTIRKVERFHKFMEKSLLTIIK